MKFNKRILSVLLALILVFSMVACSDNNTNNTSMEVANNVEVANNNANEAVEAVEAVEVVEENVLENAVNGYFENLPDHIYKIGQAEFVQKVIDNEDIYVIDIRQADAYNEGHIIGAVNMPWGPAISDNLSNIPTDKEVFIHCYSGQTAGQAIHTLNVAGIPSRSVNLGWNFGISKVEGFEEATTTEATEIVALGNEIDPEIQTALDAYYASLADVAGTTFGNHKVSEDNLKKMIDENEDFYLLSIRQEKDYVAGHIAGAELLSFGKNMNEGFANLPKDKKIVVYCYSGQTAGQTTAALRLLGFDAVSLNGGMGVGSNAPIGWSNKGYMVESSLTIAVNGYFENLPEHIYKISQVDFIQKVIDNEDMYVIDIRKADAYNEGHIIGAVNMPWGTAISDNLLNIPTDKEVFIYCYSGQTAGQAIHTLNVAGIPSRSVNLGWNFGISKVEGYEVATTTEVTEIVALGNDIDPVIQAGIDNYYASLADVVGTTFANHKISEGNLKKMIDENEDFYLLSIRQEKDYTVGHIAGAELLSFGKDMNAGFANLPRDKKIVVYCYSGQTAGQTTAALRLLGFDAVSLNGGMGVGSNAPKGWLNQGYEIVE